MRAGRGRCVELDYEQAHLLVDFRIARQNEAARAADATAWVLLAFLIFPIR